MGKKDGEKIRIKEGHGIVCFSFPLSRHGLNFTKIG